MSSDIRIFHKQLGQSRRVLAILGAGLGVASGLPTFRGTGGLWRNHDAVELATPEAFQDNPQLVWEFYNARRHAALGAMPNSGHYALSRLAKKWNSDKFLTLSQNVDGLCDRAGYPKESLVNLHGDLFTLLCTSFSCHWRGQNFSDPIISGLGRTHDPGELGIDDLPKCPKCGSLVRPGVVWFGEPLPLEALTRADDFISSGEVDLLLVIGMSATVWPAAGYIQEVVDMGGKVAVFNTDATTKIPDGWYFSGDAANTLPKALEPVIGS